MEKNKAGAGLTGGSHLKQSDQRRTFREGTI